MKKLINLKSFFLQLRGLTLLLTLLFSLEINNAWGAENDTHDFTQSLSQLLNNNASINSINIAEQSYPVKEVIISFRYNKTIENAVTMEVSVGGTSWGTKYSAGTGSNYADSSFTHVAASGAIAISFTNNTGSGTGHGTFYVNNIRLVEGASAASDPYTVTFDPEGGYFADTTPFSRTSPSYQIDEASAGAGVTLPTASSNCNSDGWSFAGWKETSAVSEETTTAPTLLSAGSTFHPTSNVTLYAVYQKDDLSTDYEKITSTAALTSGSNYVIARGTNYGLDASQYYMDSNDGYFGVTAISVSNNIISNPSSDLIWRISGNNTDGYSIYNTNQDLYIGYSTTYHDLYANSTQHNDYTIT